MLVVWVDDRGCILVLTSAGTGGIQRLLLNQGGSLPGLTAGVESWGSTA